MDPQLDTVSIKALFTETLRRSFGDLDIPDRGALGYLADLLTRYAAVAELHPADASGTRLDGVADRLGAIRQAWDPASPHFAPGHEVEIRRTMADYSLFMSGFFWERVRDASMTRHYVRVGKRGYRFLAEYHRARQEPQAAVYAILAARFETFAAVVSYMRDVHLGADFAPWPHKVFARIIGH